MTQKRRILPPDERKKEILDAATEIFSSKGYRAASVTDVLERAGIARGTFYHYFGSKKDVFLELIEFYFTEFEKVLEECHIELMSALDAGTSPLEAWKDYSLRVLHYHSENPELTVLIYREAMGLDEQFFYKADEFSDLGTKQIAADLQVMIDHGYMPQCDVDFAAAIVAGATVNIILEYIVRRGTKDLESLAWQLALNQVKALAPPFTT